MTRNDEKILAALMTSTSVNAAAAAAGVCERTIYTRLQAPGFRAEYQRRRSETLDNACKALQDALNGAVKVLTGIMKDASVPAPSRISAARSVMEYGVKMTELTSLAARVEALEAAAKEAKQ